MAPRGRPQGLWAPVERLRRVWTPEKELYELADKLEPSTELDSKIRELFSRMAMRVGSIELDVTEPTFGYVRWEEIQIPSGRRIVTVWWTPDPEGER
jgi:hypothetical protein